MIYQFKPGSRFPVSAQVAGEELERIERINGILTPKATVEESRDPSTPLHPVFKWDDEEAAELYRESQARQLIRCVYPVVTSADGTDQPVLGWIHIRQPENEQAYIQTARVFTDAELTQIAMDDALRQLEAWKSRHKHLAGLQAYFEALEQAAAETARKAKRKDQRRKGAKAAVAARA